MIRVMLVASPSALSSELRAALVTASDDLLVVPDSEGTPPEVILVVADSGENAALATMQTVQRWPAAPVVVVAAPTALGAVRKVLEAGASGFLLADLRPAAVVAAVRASVLGVAPLDPRAVASLVAIPRRPAITALPALTVPENRVLGALCRGRTNREIAAELFLQEGTVRNRVSRVLQKLGVRNRIEAVLLARQSDAGEGFSNEKS